MLLLTDWPSWNLSHTLTAGSTAAVVVRSKELSGDGDSPVEAEDDENLCFFTAFDLGDGVEL